MKRHKQRYDNTYLGHKVYVIMSSVKHARQMGFKTVHCLLADDDLFNSEIKHMTSNDRKALCIQRVRLKNEKHYEKTYHEYSSMNEMNKVVLNICKNDVQRKITFEEELKLDDFE